MNLIGCANFMYCILANINGFYAYQFSGHAKSLISVVHDMQEKDQRITMLQLVDKMKVKNKDVG